MKPRAYELIPFRLVQRGIPIPARSALPNAAPEDRDTPQWPSEIPIVEVHTRATSCERALNEGQALLKRARRRVEQGDRFALLELLDDNPAFIADAWVRETLGRLIEGGLSLRRPGRPNHRYRVNPLMVTGLVEHLIATGKARNPEQAFARLEALGVLSADFAKECFYRARREKRFESVLMTFPELRQLISAEEHERRLAHGEKLHEVRRIQRRWQDPALGTVAFRIAAEG
jgi:hypothetical protein